MLYFFGVRLRRFIGDAAQTCGSHHIAWRVLGSLRSQQVCSLRRWKQKSHLEADLPLWVPKVLRMDGVVIYVHLPDHGLVKEARHLSEAGRQTVRAIDCDRAEKGGPRAAPALSFAVMPQKHAYIGCDRGYRPPFVISKL
jgi:hypothetical protein